MISGCAHDCHETVQLIGLALLVFHSPCAFRHKEFEDSVSLRFEFSFMNGSSFEPILDHFGHVCYVVAFQIRYVSNLVSCLAQVSSCARIILVLLCLP